MKVPFIEQGHWLFKKKRPGRNLPATERALEAEIVQNKVGGRGLIISNSAVSQAADSNRSQKATFYSCFFLSFENGSPCQRLYFSTG